MTLSSRSFTKKKKETEAKQLQESFQTLKADVEKLTKKLKKGKNRGEQPHNRDHESGSSSKWTKAFEWTNMLTKLQSQVNQLNLAIEQEVSKRASL